MTKAEIKERITEIRHWLHQHPETAMEEYQTSAYIADIMEELGCQVTRGVGGTGVVATMTRGDSGRMIGLRADIDALPLTELAESPWKSTTPGKFHGCGHDSHAASLIGAAMLLRENPDFNGTVVFLFQPGEEPGVGAKAMIEDGLFERFPMQEIYGQHNKPQLPLGQIAVRPGKFMSSEDDFWITIHGLGGHASAPHNTRDPLVTAAEIVLQLQTVISRSLNPLEAGTISCCDIKTDGVLNAIPSTVTIIGDCRAYNPAVQDLIESRMCSIVQHVCEMNGCEWELRYDRVFVPVMNDEACVQAVVDAATKLYGPDMVDPNTPMGSGSEDFAWYQQHIPGAYFNVGTRPEGAETVYPQHNARYVFNDDAILYGSEVFTQLVYDRLK